MERKQKDPLVQPDQRMPPVAKDSYNNRHDITVIKTGIPLIQIKGHSS